MVPLATVQPVIDVESGAVNSMKLPPGLVPVSKLPLITVCACVSPTPVRSAAIPKEMCVRVLRDVFIMKKFVPESFSHLEPLSVDPLHVCERSKRHQQVNQKP